jgi:hypothetical protein
MIRYMILIECVDGLRRLFFLLTQKIPNMMITNLRLEAISMLGKARAKRLGKVSPSTIH